MSQSITKYFQFSVLFQWESRREIHSNIKHSDHLHCKWTLLSFFYWTNFWWKRNCNISAILQLTDIKCRYLVRHILPRVIVNFYTINNWWGERTRYLIWLLPRLWQNSLQVNHDTSVSKSVGSSLCRNLVVVLQIVKNSLLINHKKEKYDRIWKKKW